MYRRNDITLAVDYHDNNITVRRFNCYTGEERILRCSTMPGPIGQLVDNAVSEAAKAGGQVIWIMESTTGWARLKKLIGSKVHFIVANVLQIPLPPKAYRRKTDKIDTKRILREFLNGSVPQAYQPPLARRRVLRLVTVREALVSRRTAVRNWIDRYLAHETWQLRTGLWSASGIRWLREFTRSVRGFDRVVLATKLAELEQLEELLHPVETQILRVYKRWRQAQRLDEIYGIAEISAVSILARIWPVSRFGSAEELISFAGLAPGVQQSDQTRRTGHIGGGGTDKHLRHYLIEATVWAGRIPRYRATYERVMRKRGKKIGWLVVARMLVRSIYKMLTDAERFDRLPATVAKRQCKEYEKSELHPGKYHCEVQCKKRH